MKRAISVGRANKAPRAGGLGWLVAVAIGFAVPTLLSAQPVSVYTDLAEIGTDGNVIAPDSPREILSPAIPRNGFASFQIAVQVPEGKEFELHMGLNPEKAVKVTLYRRGENGVLEQVKLPYEGKSTQVFWLDLWADKTDPVRRIKVEPQVLIDDDWVIYPMEVRVRELTIPDQGPRVSGLRTYLCTSKKDSGLEDGMLVNIAALRARNEMQEVRLAATGTDKDREELRKLIGGCNANAKAPANPEWYLQVRDYFYKPLWQRIK
jgi:hypothetical protein